MSVASSTGDTIQMTGSVLNQIAQKIARELKVDDNDLQVLTGKDAQLQEFYGNLAFSPARRLRLRRSLLSASVAEGGAHRRLAGEDAAPSIGGLRTLKQLIPSTSEFYA